MDTPRRLRRAMQPVPDPPVQDVVEGYGRRAEPERELLTAILYEAAHTLQRGCVCQRRARLHQREQRCPCHEAARWVLAHDTYFTAFDTVCAILALDAPQLRKRLQRQFPLTRWAQDEPAPHRRQRVFTRTLIHGACTKNQRPALMRVA